MNGFRCVAVDSDSERKGRGKIWISTENALVVRIESFSANGRFVQDLHDIRIADPDASRFKFPEKYKIDFSDCFSCPNNDPQEDAPRK